MTHCLQNYAGVPIGQIPITWKFCIHAVKKLLEELYLFICVSAFVFVYLLLYLCICVCLLCEIFWQTADVCRKIPPGFALESPSWTITTLLFRSNIGHYCPPLPSNKQCSEIDLYCQAMENIFSFRDGRYQWKYIHL